MDVFQVASRPGPGGTGLGRSESIAEIGMVRCQPAIEGYRLSADTVGICSIVIFCPVAGHQTSKTVPQLGTLQKLTWVRGFPPGVRESVLRASGCWPSGNLLPSQPHPSPPATMTAILSLWMVNG
jgi:hypothetical protein